MAKYSKALTNTSDIMVSNNLPFLVDYMEQNNDFNPDKEYMVSKKQAKKISEQEEFIDEDTAHSPTKDLQAS